VNCDQQPATAAKIRVFMRNIILIFIPFIFLCSCYNKQKHLGEVSPKNLKNVYFDLYQSELNTANVGINYNIVVNDQIVFRHFLSGTDKHEREGTADFTADSHDSIIFLTYEDPDLVYVLYDLKTKKDPMDVTFLQKPDSLLEAKLKAYRPALKFAWR
jgi:hypothetical protein